MNSHTQSDFFLLRYVPDTIKNEFVNIAVVLRTPSGPEIRFTTDKRRLLCMDPDADMDWLVSLEHDLRRILSGGDEQLLQFKKLTESLSNTIQLSPVKGILAENPSAEADKLAQIYLETTRMPEGGRVVNASIRRRLYAQMSGIFEQAGVWDAFTKDIEARKYTHPGDPFKFDCGYPCKLARKKLRLFHAVAIESSTVPAKSLGYTWPSVRDGIMCEEGTTATLTAVIRDGLNVLDGRIAFSLSTFARGGIKVATLAQLPQLADQARRELGL